LKAGFSDDKVALMDRITTIRQSEIRGAHLNLAKERTLKRFSYTKNPGPIRAGGNGIRQIADTAQLLRVIAHGAVTMTKSSPSTAMEACRSLLNELEILKPHQAIKGEIYVPLSQAVQGLNQVYFSEAALGFKRKNSKGVMASSRSSTLKPKQVAQQYKTDVNPGRKGPVNASGLTVPAGILIHTINTANMSETLRNSLLYKVKVDRSNDLWFMEGKKLSWKCVKHITRACLAPRSTGIIRMEDYQKVLKSYASPFPGVVRKLENSLTQAWAPASGKVI